MARDLEYSETISLWAPTHIFCKINTVFSHRSLKHQGFFGSSHLLLKWTQTLKMRIALTLFTLQRLIRVLMFTYAFVFFMLTIESWKRLFQSITVLLMSATDCVPPLFCIFCLNIMWHGRTTLTRNSLNCDGLLREWINDHKAVLYLSLGFPIS